MNKWVDKNILGKKINKHFTLLYITSKTTWHVKEYEKSLIKKLVCEFILSKLT